MWNRKELKEQGKAAVKRNYWKSVLIGIVDMLAAGGAYAASRASGVDDATANIALEGFSASAVLALVVALFVAIALVALVELVLKSLLIGPLQVGNARLKLSVLKGTGNLMDLGSGFTNNYKNNFKTMFLSSLYIGLWSLVLVVPGIIKSYEYRMVPYILAENPDMSSKEVLARSKAMMQGNKWNTFVLDLSFILWDILSSVTAGLVGVFYAQPYQSMTGAALYEALKAEQ